MRSTIRIATFLLALMLVSPLASAGWKMFGSFEPDTPQDNAGGFMHLDPDASTTSGVGKVYFNAELGYDQMGVNPNVGALETRLLLEGFQHPRAFLGVWKDCNADGYIGYGAGALIEYRNELLMDETAICPPGSSDHNANGWVYEFLPIGPADNVWDPSDALPRLINDTGAFVWGDIGLPGSQTGGGCYVNPPTGTFSSTGAFIGWSDCLAGYLVADTLLLADPNGDLGLSWADRTQPHCSDSALNVRLGLFADAPQCPDDDPGLWEEGTEKPLFTAFDCSAEPAFAATDSTGLTRQTIVDPTGGELTAVFGDDGEASIRLSDENGTIATVPAVTPGVADPDGSAYDAVNDTDKATLGGCDDASVGFYLSPEADVANDQSVRRETDFPMEFYDDFGHSIALWPADFADPDFPRYGGVTPVRSLTLMPIWTSHVLSSNSVILRGDYEPAGAAYYTFYARVSLPSLVEGAPGELGIYGSEWCAGASASDIVRNFDCDADNWWDPAKGASPMPTELWTDRPIGQAPGVAYHLRDIDCYDGTVMDPVRLGLGDFSTDGICPQPTP